MDQYINSALSSPGPYLQAASGADDKGGSRNDTACEKLPALDSVVEIDLMDSYTVKPKMASAQTQQLRYFCLAAMPTLSSLIRS